ncbi:STAS domain-containing protein [Silvimonas sp.]|uniref:STAS domain-containing protein n=1 Tax=Silvimonas sp. TaxID=2650811 RepID=UPI00283B86F1|nr:STAS domain-containing protein [Silvimonas sp.]MDR3430216.1 STAS domain-containing protein [Silvimonas sp.]
MMPVDSAGPVATCKFEGEITIFRAAELKDTLLQALALPEPALEIDLSSVEEIDSTGIQLLLALQQEARRQDKTVICTQPSPQFLAVAQLLNLADRLLAGPVVLVEEG